MFSKGSDTLIIFDSPKWLFGKDGRNLVKIQTLHREGQLGLIAIDKAHLMYDWQDFNHIRGVRSYMILGTPLMALSVTVTPQIQRALENFLHNPVVEFEKSTIDCDNVFLV